MAAVLQVRSAPRSSGRVGPHLHPPIAGSTVRTRSRVPPLGRVAARSHLAVHGPRKDESHEASLLPGCSRRGPRRRPGGPGAGRYRDALRHLGPAGRHRRRQRAAHHRDRRGDARARGQHQRQQARHHHPGPGDPGHAGPGLGHGLPVLRHGERLHHPEPGVREDGHGRRAGHHLDRRQRRDDPGQPVPRPVLYRRGPVFAGHGRQWRILRHPDHRQRDLRPAPARLLQRHHDRYRLGELRARHEGVGPGGREPGLQREHLGHGSDCERLRCRDPRDLPGRLLHRHRRHGRRQQRRRDRGPALRAGGPEHRARGRRRGRGWGRRGPLSLPDHRARHDPRGRGWHHPGGGRRLPRAGHHRQERRDPAGRGQGEHRPAVADHAGGLVLDPLGQEGHPHSQRRDGRDRA